MNSTDLCEGVITRFRKTVNGSEKSVLDYFIVCKQLLKLITKLVIDEERKYPLTKYSTTTGQKEVKERVHNLMILNLKIRWSSLHRNNQRIEIFIFKNNDDFEKFRCETETNDELLSCCDNVTDLNTAALTWLKLLKKKC